MGIKFVLDVFLRKLQQCKSALTNINMPFRAVDNGKSGFYVVKQSITMVTSEAIILENVY
jgi:hypothetical protein